jgi:hypothetical protein
LQAGTVDRRRGRGVGERDTELPLAGRAAANLAGKILFDVERMTAVMAGESNSHGGRGVDEWG